MRTKNGVNLCVSTGCLLSLTLPVDKNRKYARTSGINVTFNENI